MKFSNEFYVTDENNFNKQSDFYNTVMFIIRTLVNAILLSIMIERSQTFMQLNGIVMRNYSNTSSLMLMNQNGNLNGERYDFKYISFSEPFDSNPEVVIAIVSYDVDKTKNLRLRASALDITTTGFQLAIQTWEDSIIYRVSIQWLAFLNDAIDMNSES